MSVTLDGSEPIITWMDIGNAAFSEPFFDDTVYRKKRDRSTTSIETSYEELRAAADPSCVPAGFIFHMSRCGSTLLSQMLKEIPGVRVYSESAPVNLALLLEKQLPPDIARGLLDATIRALCSNRGNGPTRHFFKFSSWSILQYSLIAELFPTVPMLFVVRRPVEVLASIAKEPTGFVLQRAPFAEAVRRRAGEHADALDDLEFAAVVLSLFLDAMAAAVHPGGPKQLRRVLDYSELPSAALRTLPRFFGIPEDCIDVQRVEAVTRFHAKSLRRVPFQKEAESVVHADPLLLEQYAARWVDSRYEALIAGSSFRR